MAMAHSLDRNRIGLGVVEDQGTSSQLRRLGHARYALDTVNRGPYAV